MPAEPVAPPSDGVFTVARRGYDPQQVDAHLRRLDAEIRILVADRDAAVDQSAQLQRELDEARLRSDRLRTQVRTMAARPSDVQGMSERMRTMLRLAEDEVADMLRRADAEVARRLGEVDGNADDVLAVAHREAAEVRDAARAEAEETTAAAARHRAETDAACAADRQAVAAERAAAAQAIAEVNQQAERSRAQAWADSEARRAEIEEDFTLAMDQRRTEALAEMHTERARTAAWVQRSRDETTRQCRVELAQAEETARRIVASAQERVAELADVRGRIAAQLYGTQDQLHQVLTALAPGAERQALPSAVNAPIAATATPVEPAPLPAPEAPVVLESAQHAVEPEPATRPIPVTTAGTVVLDAPAEPVSDAQPEPAVVDQEASRPETRADAPTSADVDETGRAPVVPSQTASGESVTGPVAPEQADIHRPNARRRRRRPATGATRR
jgi:DivIVA domain-containing protein